MGIINEFEQLRKRRARDGFHRARDRPLKKLRTKHKLVVGTELFNGDPLTIRSVTVKLTLPGHPEVADYKLRRCRREEN
jgi:hypothetical protein